jgi:hypothetical protein
MQLEEKPYDPLDYDNLAKSVVTSLLERQPEKLPPEKLFKGIGVYCIYYKGDFRPYRKISSADSKTPIYVGQATPGKARKGASFESAMEDSSLHTRLCQHTKSIDSAENLEIKDFYCRYLIVVPVWVGLAEQFLISHYQPIWNTLIDGFGNHDPGKGRKDMRRPRWDILHPGREWAKRLKAEETRESLIALVEEALSD